jgi:hypothetical protein
VSPPFDWFRNVSSIYTWPTLIRRSQNTAKGKKKKKKKRPDQNHITR